jgi:hypothetical protein
VKNRRLEKRKTPEQINQGFGDPILFAIVVAVMGFTTGNWWRKFRCKYGKKLIEEVKSSLLFTCYGTRIKVLTSTICHSGRLGLSRGYWQH